MKHTLHRRLFCNYDEPNDIEHYAQIMVLRNNTTNADKSVTVIVHTGIYVHDMHENPNFRISGGELKVFTNQTEKQVDNRLKRYMRAFDARTSETRTFEDVARLKEVMEDYFGAARAKPIVKAAELNLHYMERVVDGSVVLEGETFAPGDAVPARSVDAEPKPMGWGAW